MCFSSVLWLMVIDCLPVFLLGFDCLSVFVEENFSFVYFLFIHLFFHIYFSDVPYFSCSLFSLFLTRLHQVSAGPPLIWKGTLPMLYYIYRR